MSATHRVLVGALLTPFIIIGLGVLAFVVNGYLNSRAGKAFYSIALGTTESEVEALLGKPSVRRPCGTNLWWGDDAHYRGENDGRCVTETRYEYFLSAWGIGYSADHRVVSKYHYFSE